MEYNVHKGRESIREKVRQQQTNRNTFLRNALPFAEQITAREVSAPILGRTQNLFFVRVCSSSIEPFSVKILIRRLVCNKSFIACRPKQAWHPISEQAEGTSPELRVACGWPRRTKER